MIFIIMGIIVPVSLALMVGQLHSRKAAKVYQTMMFLPYFLSWVVVTDCIANYDPDVIRTEQEFKVFEPDPVAVYNITKKIPVNLEILESDNDSEHRQEAEQNVPDCGRKHEQRELGIMLAPACTYSFAGDFCSHIILPFL
jgi:hypothetical protein